MRVPTSSLVMALLTAVPFGLAIRDTVVGHERVAFGEVLAFDDQPQDLAPDVAVEPEVAEVEARDGRQQLFNFVGTTRAALGPVFAELPLGSTAEEIAAARDGILDEAKQHAIRVTVHATTRLDTITLHGGVRSMSCPAWPDYLDEAWGPAEPRGVWENSAIGQRARFSAEPCKLVVESFVGHERWVSDLPVVFEGKPVATLQQAVAAETEDDGSLRWTTPGLIGGEGPTTFTAHVKAGVVTRIIAEVEAPPDAYAWLVAQLVTQLDTEIGGHVVVGHNPDDAYTEWSAAMGHPAMTVAHDDHHVTLTIGKP